MKTREPVTVEIDDPISIALAAKLGDVFCHLPVMESGQVVGILSYRDIPPEFVTMFEHLREMRSARADDEGWRRPITRHSCGVR
ncbi:MAG: CBS domain-containing protein [Rhodobacter sp.]|nr:CBS domain-containing protein [Rhodobacter sp.]